MRWWNRGGGLVEESLKKKEGKVGAEHLKSGENAERRGLPRELEMPHWQALRRWSTLDTAIMVCRPV